MSHLEEIDTCIADVVMECFSDMKEEYFYEGFLNNSDYTSFLRTIMPHIYIRSQYVHSDSEHEPEAVTTFDYSDAIKNLV